MPIRLKAFLIIAVIVAAITASSVIISISSAQGQILKTLEVDMRLVASLANEFISGEMDMLTSSAATVAQKLKQTPLRQLPQVLIEQVAAYDYFSAIAICDEDGMIELSYGAMAVNNEFNRVRYARQAAEGRRVISTSYMDPSGHVVFYVFVPLNDYLYEQKGELEIHPRMIVCTVSGDFFSQQLSRYLIWNTGNISMSDREGTVIANIHTEWVTERLNFLTLAEKDSQYDGIARAVRRMIAGGSGTERFMFEGDDVLTAYMPVTASTEGWSLSVIAPIKESPFYNVRMMIAIAGVVFLVLGLSAAAFSSGVIARPFHLLRAQNQRLIELGEAAQAAAKVKADFLANMSHEMRTPLNVIIGFSELGLQKEGLAPGTEYSLKKIYESGVVMLGVVNNLLDISNLESGRFEIIPDEYDFAYFINETATVNKIRAGSKPVTFNLTLDGNLPARLIGDELRVKQIFGNLLSNAFNFTNEGTVDWHISAEKDGDHIWLVSTVSDTGTGIKPEDIDTIFVDYHQMAAWNSHNPDGTGLGLALSQKIAGLMGGVISVESVYGKGSAFSVRIRQKPVNDEVIGSKAAENLMQGKYVEQKRLSHAELKRVQLPHKRVLIVDDIQINIEVAKGMLAPYGLQIDYVNSGAETVELVRKGEPRYDAIFLDHMMPEMDGIETVRIIRDEIDSNYSRNVPVIVVTANVVTGNNKVFMACGFQDFLAKPIDALSLDRVIHHWLAGEKA